MFIMLHLVDTVRDSSSEMTINESKAKNYYGKWRLIEEVLGFALFGYLKPALA